MALDGRIPKGKPVFSVVENEIRSGQEIPLKVHSRATSCLAVPQWGGIMGGHQCLYISGAVEYKDVLGNDHRTRFCFFIKGSILERGFTPAEIGNDAN